MPGLGESHTAQCRAILRTWRENPTFDFAEPYEDLGARLGVLANDTANARLIDGVVVRIGRGDPPVAIEEWAAEFARKRGLSWLSSPP